MVRVAEGSACTLRADGGISCWGSVTTANTSGGYLNGSNASATPIDIDFCSLPTVTGLNPPFGRASGGAMITVTGTEFNANTQVFFGQPLPQNQATAVTFTNDTTIVATAPAHGFGELVEVWVVNPTNRRALLPMSFTFTDPPSVYGSTPMSGPITGGTQVELNGANFAQGATVTFGGTAASVSSVPDIQHAIVTTPPHAAGAVDIILTNPDGQSATLAMGFVYGQGGQGGDTTSSGGSSAEGGSQSGSGGADGGGEGPGDGCYCATTNGDGRGEGGILLAFALTALELRRRARACRA